jgi:hypothetical protein
MASESVSQEHVDLMFRVYALEALMIWLAAQEIKRSGDAPSFLAKMADELHAQIDRSTPPNPMINYMISTIGANLDRLVQGISREASS